MKQRFKILLNVIVIHLGLAFLFAFAMFQGDGFSWFLFFGFLPVYVYLMGAIFYPVKKWHVRRILNKQHVFAGQSVPVIIDIKRTLPFPIFYCVVEERFSDTFNQLNYGADKYQNLNQSTLLYRRMKKMVFPGFKKSIQLNYEIENIPRGEHTLDAIRIETADLFGVIKKEVLFPLRNVIRAMPQEKEIPLTYLRDTYVTGSDHLQQGGEQTTIVTGVRPYVAGDRMTAIDWKQTARKQELMTREYETESATKKIIMLDGSYVENMNVLALEACIEIGLFVTRKQMEKGHVEFVLFSDKVWHVSCTHPQQLELLRQRLATLRPVQTNPLPILVEEAVQRLGTMDHIVLLTAHITGSSMEAYLILRTRARALTILYVHAANTIDQTIQTVIETYRQKDIEVILLDEKRIQGNSFKEVW